MRGVVAQVAFVDVEGAFAVQLVQHIALAAGDGAHGAKPLPAPIEPWPMCQPGPSKPMPTTLVAEMPSGPHTRAPVKRPPSPASPPDTTTPPLPSVVVRPSTSALPLMPALAQHQHMPQIGVGQAGCRALACGERVGHVGQFHAGHAEGGLAKAQRGDDDAAVAHALAGDFSGGGAAHPLRLGNQGPDAIGIQRLHGRLANTSTRWGCKLANGATSEGAISAP